MRVLVTGATGLLGNNVVKTLTDRGYHVNVIVRDEQNLCVRNEKVDVYKGSFLSFDDLSAASTGCDAIIHAGAATDMSLGLDDFINVNVGGVKNIIDVSKKNNIENLIESIPRILYKLNELSNISAFIDPRENAFKKFAASVWIYMKGNYESDFPRSIVNYSAFQFAVPGYPFNTPSRRIYSVSNLPRVVTNKLQIEEVFIKNISALTDYLCDATKLLSVENICELSSDDKTILVKNIYASIISIISLYGEVKIWERINNGKLIINDTDKQCQLLDTQGVQINEIIRK